MGAIAEKKSLTNLVILCGLVIVVMVGVSTCTRVATEKPPSWGGNNEALLVTNSRAIPQSYVKIITDSLMGVFPGLPQPEPHINVIVIDSSVFSSIHKKHRSIVILKVGQQQNQISIKENLWAKNQKVFVIEGGTPENILHVFLIQRDMIKREIINSTMRFVSATLLKERNKEAENEIYNITGRRIPVPMSYYLTVRKENTVAIRKELKVRNAGMDANVILGCLITFLPYRPDTNYLINTIDSIIGKNVIGGDTSEYMRVVREPLPPIISQEDRYVIVRGLWRLNDVFRGGPFISIVKNVQTSTVIFYGYVYGPAVQKRDYMIEIESLGRSIMEGIS